VGGFLEVPDFSTLLRDGPCATKDKQQQTGKEGERLPLIEFEWRNENVATKG